MSNAPPVAFPVGRFVGARAAWLLLVLLSAGGLLAWSQLAQVSTALVMAAWSLWGLCGVGAWLGGKRQTLSDGQLRWDGQSWFWQPRLGQGFEIQLTVGLDLGQGLLLWARRDLGPAQGLGLRVCAWVSQSAMPSNWHGFRCAVYCRHAGPDPSAEPRA